MPRDWQLRVEDILEAIARVQRYLEGMGQADFIADDRTVDAVVRNFGTIGEAVSHLPAEIRDAHPEILWSTAKEDRPPLVDRLQAMINKA